MSLKRLGVLSLPSQSILSPIQLISCLRLCSQYFYSFYNFFDHLLNIAEEKYTVEYYLPQTLDSIPYLNASSRVHIANDYFMFDGSGLHENTTFTLKEVFNQNNI